MAAKDLVVLTWCGVDEPLVELSRIVSAEIAQALRQGGAEPVREWTIEGDSPDLTGLSKGSLVVPLALGRANSGQLQLQLELAGLAFVGSGSRACRAAGDERVLRPLLTQAGVPVTPYLLCERGNDVRAKAAQAVQRFPGGCMIRPTLPEAMPVQFAGPEAVAVRAALEKVLAAVGAALIEAVQPLARRLSLACWRQGGHDVCLPVVELVEPRLDFTTFHSPGDCDHVCPAVIGAQQLGVLQGIALAAHRALGCVLSRTEIYMNHEGHPCVSAFAAAPLLFPTSLLARAAVGAGMDFTALMLCLVANARLRHTHFS